MGRSGTRSQPYLTLNSGCIVIALDSGEQRLPPQMTTLRCEWKCHREGLSGGCPEGVQKQLPASPLRHHSLCILREQGPLELC